LRKSPKEAAVMGKVFLVFFGIAVGYGIGFRDARAHTDHIVVRVVDHVKVMFGATPTNDIDAVMTKVEGKN
jgi:hypothetical protein